MTRCICVLLCDTWYFRSRNVGVAGADDHDLYLMPNVQMQRKHVEIYNQFKFNFYIGTCTPVYAEHERESPAGYKWIVQEILVENYRTWTTRTTLTTIPATSQHEDTLVNITNVKPVI